MVLSSILGWLLSDQSVGFVMLIPVNLFVATHYLVVGVLTVHDSSSVTLLFLLNSLIMRIDVHSLPV